MANIHRISDYVQDQPGYGGYDLISTHKIPFLYAPPNSKSPLDETILDTIKITFCPTLKLFSLTTLITVGLITIFIVSCFMGVDRSVSILQIQSSVLIKLGANVPARVFDGQVYRLITAAFLHANLTHLLSNLLSILIIFSRLEQCYSIFEVSLLYIISGVSGNILSNLTSRSSYQVAVGASTAIMGFIGALISYLIINWSSLAVLGSLRRRLTFTIGFLVFSSILYSMIITRSSVDVYGHVGGFFGGLFSSLLIFPPINPRQSLVIKIIGTILITGYLLTTSLCFYLLKY